MKKSLFQGLARAVWRGLPYLPAIVFASILVCVARDPTVLCGPIITTRPMRSALAFCVPGLVVSVDK